ncbi:SRPBCC family protein [Labedaea rhizosphaerae]|uniref:Polyketide cyclase/dehydrase/lipid transport protein n=1 Tax=Labedaea rhizosphaerae TaxID=598644 RepID=A0A4R6RVY8_LABRH|nr:SRPBCC family protein [Labedaea rhizosphaerae]TDP90485.1 polyketide cyclase/dehydrase/lipid transport protein [Labedaea rhizosphaerae]
MTYGYEHSVETSASPEAVWALWSDVSRWTEWDTSLTAMRMDGPFEPGATGVMTIEGQGDIDFRLTEVEPGVGFTDETVLPIATLTFGHTMTPLAGGRLRITHRVTIEGAAAQELGPQVTEDVPDAMAGLVAIAERETASSPA